MDLILFLSFLIGTCFAYKVSALPTGFVDELVVEHEDAVNIEFIRYSNGIYHMLLSNRQGEIYIVKDPESPEKTKQLVADLAGKVCDDGSRGLLGITAHPDFDNKPWIYLFYTRITNGACKLSRKNGPVNRFARYNMTNNKIDLDSELILFETSPGVKNFHNGGKAHFGNDGMIYIMTGDAGDSYSAQNLGDLLGKAIRLTEDGEIPRGGNAFTIKNHDKVARCNVLGVPPAGSPANTKCAEIWAFGFRNPFRFSMDPNTGSDKTKFYVNDVGGAFWEEISVGGTDHKGVNYGWGIREGPCDRSSATDCTSPPEYQDPEYWYSHDGIKGPGGGAAIIGGAVIPDGAWPAKYDGKHIFGDYVFQKLYLLTPTMGCRECIPPLPNYVNTTFHGVPKPVNVEFGPYKDTQALYYTSRESKNGSVRRIVYTGETGNRPPVAVLTSDVVYVDVGGWVNFDASLSFDPDGKGLKYSYSFGEGDGYTKWSRSRTVSHQFKRKGRFRVKLRVKETGPKKRLRARDSIIIVVDDLPKAKIVSPAEGDQFAVGDVLTLVGRATDYDGNPLPGSFMSWEVRKHHNTHYHPFKEGTGKRLKLPNAPEPEDFFAATNSYLEVILTVRDRNKLKRVVRRNVMPKLVEVNFDTDPSGLKLTLFEQDLTMPQRVSCWENQRLRVAPYSNNESFEFESWSDGGAEEHDIVIPAKSDTVPLFLASFRNSSVPT